MIVVTLDEPFTAAECDPIRTWRESHKKGFLHATSGGKLLPVRFRALDKLGAKDYREAVPLNLPRAAAAALLVAVGSSWPAPPVGPAKKVTSRVIARKCGLSVSLRAWNRMR